MRGRNENKNHGRPKAIFDATSGNNFATIFQGFLPSQKGARAIGCSQTPALPALDISSETLNGNWARILTPSEGQGHFFAFFVHGDHVLGRPARRDVSVRAAAQGPLLVLEAFSEVTPRCAGALAISCSSIAGFSGAAGLAVVRMVLAVMRCSCSSDRADASFSVGLPSQVLLGVRFRPRFSRARGDERSRKRQ